MAVGPVEYLVIAFPGDRFTDAIAPAVADAVVSEAVRILDLTFVHRGEDGTLELKELRDLDPDGLGQVAAEVPGLLNTEDIDTLGQRVPPGNSAVLIVWEDLWAVPLTRSVHAAGGEIVAHERVPADRAEAAVRAARTGGGRVRRDQWERLAPEPEGDDVINRLERLAELKQQGILTDAEFAAQKTRILAD